MSVERLLEVAVVGATGAVGSELIAVLSDRAFPMSRLRPIASEESFGDTVEYRGQDVPVETDVRSLTGIDLVFLCAPPDVSLEYAGLALRARVPAIDLSGALLGQPDVDLVVGEWLDSDAELVRPLVASPGGTALAIAMILAALDPVGGLVRAVVTTFEAAGVLGRAAVDALSEESIALFNQEPLPDEPLAFDCRPAVGAPEASGATPHEERMLITLERLLGRPIPVAATSVRVPTFSGDGISLWVETERPLDADAVRGALEKTPGVVLWPGPSGPSSRMSVDQDAVLVGRVRSEGQGVQLWLSADGVRLAARNAVLLAEARPFPRRVS